MPDQPPTILIVDDEPQVLRLVEKMLGGRRANVLVAAKPAAALAICESQPVDVLISDVVMPEMDGRRLAERVLELHPQARVLLISGYYKDTLPTGKPGQVRFLRKPFFPSQLIEVLRELLP